MRFLFVDRILQSSPGEYVRGLKHITADDACLIKDDSGKKTLFPSSLIGEALGQLAAWNVMAAKDFSHRPVAGMVSCVRMHRSACLGETLELESFIDSLDEQAVQYHSIARVGSETVLTIEGALGPLLPMQKFIGDAEIRRQYAQINRPGEWTAESGFHDEFLYTDTENQAAACFTFDRINGFEPGISLSAEKCINGGAAYFPDHFPFNPVLPLTVLLECKLNLVRTFLSRSAFAEDYQVSELRRIKMSDFVHPGDVLQAHLHVKKQDDQQLILGFRSDVNGKRVCVLDVLLTAKELS